MSVSEMVLPNKQAQYVMLLTCIRGSLFRIRTLKPTVLTEVLIVLCPCKIISYISRRNHSDGAVAVYYGLSPSETEKERGELQ